MSEKIKPALTAEEWRMFQGIGVFARFDRMAIVADIPKGHVHAAAALALYGQPYGFSREDVVFLREVAEKVRAGAKHENWHVGDELESLAGRIEALLPPEDSTG